MSLRAAQKQMTYELFLTTALDLFGSKGYAATTIDDIATAAGSTRTTFYLHFSSKSEVISALLTKADAILTAPDDPPLTEVVASGSRPDIRTYLDRKFTQWDEIKPYLTASYQAAHEPDVAARTEQWFEDAVGEMTEGLNRTNRFAEDRRRIAVCWHSASSNICPAATSPSAGTPPRDLPRRTDRLLVSSARLGRLTVSRPTRMRTPRRGSCATSR